MAKQLSKTQVNKAGVVLVRFWKNFQLGDSAALPGQVSIDGSRVPTAAEFIAAVDSANYWRSSFGVGLTSVNMGLRSFVKTCGLTGSAVTTRRHKQLATIIQKLARSDGKSKLARLQDIAGCRVVVHNQDELEVLRGHIRDTWGTHSKLGDRINGRENDYIKSPRDTGYRAHHLVVAHKERWVEVQLRTTYQQDWADEVERIGRIFRWPELKAGVGPSEVLQLMKTVADMNALEEGGRPIPTEMMIKYRQRRKSADTLFALRKGEIRDQ